MRDIIQVLKDGALKRLAEYEAMPPAEKREEAHRSLLAAGIIQPNGELAEHLKSEPMTHHVNAKHFSGSLFKEEGVYETKPTPTPWHNRTPHPDLIRELIILAVLSKQSNQDVGRVIQGLASILMDDKDAP